MKAGIRLIDWARGTNILGKFNELKSLSENAEMMTELQKSNLTSLLKYLKLNNPIYKPLLSRFTDEEISKYPFVVLNNLPLTDKQKINSYKSSYYIADKNRPAQKKKTGGSTGAPFYYYVDKEHLSWFWAHIYFFWHKYGNYQPGDPFVTIAGNSLRTASRHFSENVYHFLQNNYFIRGDVIEKDMKVYNSKLNKAKILYGYPSSIQNIITTIPDFPGKFKNLTAIFTTSEQLTPQVRKTIEHAFGKPVFDMYGANDGGILTCECPEHNGYHINMLNCYAENFRNEHDMCEILLTNLSSFTFPFVRYQVGDIGLIDKKPCKCGLHWPRVTELKGRTRDLIKLSDGKVIHGAYFNNIFYKYPLIDGYRIVQHKDYSLEVFIHLANDLEFDTVASEIEGFIKGEWPSVVLKVSKLPELNPTNAKFKLIESHVD